VAAGRRGVMRDEDADVDTSAVPSTTASATGGGGSASNINDEISMKAAHSRRIAGSQATSYHTAGT